MEQERDDDDDESREELEPPTVGPPELKREFTLALDWHEWEQKNMTRGMEEDDVN